MQKETTGKTKKKPKPQLFLTAVSTQEHDGITPSGFCLNCGDPSYEMFHFSLDYPAWFECHQIMWSTREAPGVLCKRLTPSASAQITLAQLVAEQYAKKNITSPLFMVEWIA